MSILNYEENDTGKRYIPGGKRNIQSDDAEVIQKDGTV